MKYNHLGKSESQASKQGEKYGNCMTRIGDSFYMHILGSKERS
jgi:hypothetical protein